MREPDALPEHITRLSLTGFRNYASVSLALNSGPVVLTGENGAGKTNLLEAVSFLAPGRGMRRAHYSDIAKSDTQNGFAIHAEIEGGFGSCAIGTGTSGMTFGESGRRIRINGTQVRSSEDLLEWVRVIWLTPAMDTLFTGSASDRRRFLDRMVLTIDPAHAQRSLDFEKAMRSRNRLLSDNVRDALYFEALEVQMAETGTAIAAARVEIVRLLIAMIERLPDDSPFPKADLALQGTLEEELTISRSPAVDIEERYRERLSRERERDRAAGRTLDGPHRSDLLVRHRPKNMQAEFCSTGEQKALLIGLVLSHARLCGELSSTVPILLLDEVAAHLDQGRRAALFSILEELRSQAFMTGTEPELFSALQGRAQFLTVNAGTVVGQ